MNQKIVSNKIKNNSKDNIFKEGENIKMGINDSNNSKAIVEEENNDLFKNNDIIKNSATKSTTENNEITKDKNMELDREERKRKRSFKPTIPKNRKKFKVRDSPLNLVKILRAAHDRKSYADLSGKPPYTSSAHRSKNHIKANSKTRK